MRRFYALLAASAYLALLLLAPDFDPISLSDGYRAAFLASALALLLGLGGFVYSFAPNELESDQ